MINNQFTIITFYQFKKIGKLVTQKNYLQKFCFFNKIKGTILIAKEGINGTLAGLANPIAEFQIKLEEIGFKNLNIKISHYKYMPFNRLKIKIKKEIITFDSSLHFNNNYQTGEHVDNKNWNKLINDKETIIIDVRNKFEYEMGTFKNAINPETNKFSEFKNYISNNLNNKKQKKIAMFCTGGIRCEKASSYMIKKGFKNVYQLDGGILKYLKNTNKKNSLWKGECFVFDNRVSVKNELKIGSYELCHACRYPLSKKNRKSSKYMKGISCSYCYNKLTKEKKKNLEERNKQIKISKKKGLYNPYIKMTTLDF